MPADYLSSSISQQQQDGSLEKKIPGRSWGPNKKIPTSARESPSIGHLWTIGVIDLQMIVFGANYAHNIYRELALYFWKWGVRVERVVKNPE
jgi:hypothetical protein